MSSQEKHILIIRLSAMGDVAMTIPVILQLKKQYPLLKISILTKPFFVTLFENIDNLKVFSAEVNSKHKGLIGLYKLSKDIDQETYTDIADLHNVLRSKILSFFFRLKGLNIKHIDKGRSEKKALTRTRNKIFKPLKTTFERYAEVFEKLGYPLELKNEVLLPKKGLHSSLIENLNFYKANKHLGIAPFAAHDGKTYPADLMQDVISKLATDRSLNIYLFGSKGQEMSRLQNWAKPYDNVYCVAGYYDFKAELSLISHLDIMLSMDSGNGHLAALYGVKVITIWGQTHPFAGFAPYKQTESEQILPDRNIFPLLPTSIYGNKKVSGYDKVMRSITPETVVEKVKDYLY